MYKKLKEIVNRLDVLEQKAHKASMARFNSPAGTSRAKTTTLNARWGVYTEARELCLEEFRTELKNLGLIYEKTNI